jgi:hypothetical protein
LGYLLELIIKNPGIWKKFPSKSSEFGLFLSENLPTKKTLRLHAMSQQRFFYVKY